MIGSGRFSAAFASGADTTDPTTFRGVMKQAAKLGFALVFCETGTKLPVCTLSSVARKAADTAAQDSARAAGDRHWAKRTHDCGRAHATTDPTEIDKYLLRRFKHDGPVPNVAVEVGASRMLAIDVDTPEELAAWARSWHEATGESWPADGLTVRSPGVLDRGVWKHSGGGHVWIDLDSLPPSSDRELLLGYGGGAYKDPAGWTAMYRDRYVLVPPSVRPEGPYEYLGSSPASERIDWLVARIARHATDHEAARMEAAERRAARLADPDTKPVDHALITWSTATEWTDLLTPRGWVDTGLVDSCGCPVWTAAPVEDHASPKSATAHEDGCGAQHYSNDEGHAPLHIWTDTVPPYLVGLPKTLTKTQWLAATARPEVRHGQPLSSEDISTGLRSVGISPTGGDLRPLDSASVLVTPNPEAAAEVDPMRVQTALATLAAPATVDVPAAPVPVAPAPDAPHVTSGPGPVPDPRGLGTLGAPPELPPATGEIVPVASGAESDLVTGYQTARHFLDLASLLALPKPAPLIQGVVDQDCLARVFGASGSGKTFVMVDMAASVITGRPWAGHAVAGRGKVVYLAAEDARGVGQRFAAWVQRARLSEDETRDFISRLRVVTYAVQASNAPEWEAMIADTAAFGPALVIVDTQAQTAGGYEENSNAEMMQFIRRVDQIRVNTGACVVLVHHTGKDGREARGASSVFAALDLEYKVTGEITADAQTVAIENTKAKSRARWRDPVAGALITAGESAVVSYDPTQIPDPGAAMARADAASGAAHARSEEVLAVLAAHPVTGLSRTEWADTVERESRDATGKARIPKTTARRIINQLMSAGRVRDRDGGLLGIDSDCSRGMALFAVSDPAPESESSPDPVTGSE